MTGLKYDHGKPLPDLVLGDFMAALEQPVFAGTFGAFKYEPKNFQKLEDGERRYAEAQFRHYMKRKKGELFDTESGELHAAHELWCKIAELYFWLIENEHRTWQKSISRSDGLFHHPTLDEFGCDWQREPFWYDEEDARKIIWALAAEQKGELDIHVNVREVAIAAPEPDLYIFEEIEDEPELYLYNFLNDDYYIGNNAWEALTTRAIRYAKPVPGLLEEMPNTMFVEVKVDDWPDQADDDTVFIMLADKFLSGVGTNESEFNIDPMKAVGVHRGCAADFLAKPVNAGMRLAIHEDIWFVVAESDDYYMGNGAWVDQEFAAKVWTKKEACDHLRYLNQYSNTNPRLVAA